MSQRYTDALLEDNGLEDPIVLICQEISAIGLKLGIHTWMNYEGTILFSRLGKGSHSVMMKSESFHLIGQFTE